jgi:pimeloyl-ACP methyl ester carboxylesterase
MGEARGEAASGRERLRLAADEAGDVVNPLSDLRGASRLAFDATVGMTELVDELHATIAHLPTSLGGPVGAAVNGVTALVYGGIRTVTRAAGAGIDSALARLALGLGSQPSSPRREAIVAALNGVVGDRLAETGNPLAIAMQLRSDGKRLVLTRDALATAFPDPGRRVVVLVHGLCMNDLHWRRPAHCHGTELARRLGYTPLYLRYNTGLHVSTNGRALAGVLEALVAAWPVPLDDLAIVGHSMGGLVARSAHHYGTLAAHVWPERLRRLVFLGTPHHGAFLERAGHRLHRLVGQTPVVAPLARLGKIRSAGITDLRDGSLLDEDWQGRDRFADAADARRPVPLPGGVRCFTVGATLGTSPHDVPSRVIGDGLVPLPSALGRHDDARFALTFPDTHQWTAYGIGHFGLLDRPAVYAKIHDWLAP